MSKTRTYLLQLWQDPSGLWVVLRDEAHGHLHQFENLEALTQFLSQMEDVPPPEPLDESRDLAAGLE